jgi:hypothetical protein
MEHMVPDLSVNVKRMKAFFADLRQYSGLIV